MSGTRSMHGINKIFNVICLKMRREDTTQAGFTAQVGRKVSLKQYLLLLLLLIRAQGICPRCTAAVKTYCATPVMFN